MPFFLKDPVQLVILGMIINNTKTRYIVDKKVISIMLLENIDDITLSVIGGGDIIHMTNTYTNNKY